MYILFIRLKNMLNCKEVRKDLIMEKINDFDLDMVTGGNRISTENSKGCTKCRKPFAVKDLDPVSGLCPECAKNASVSTANGGNGMSGLEKRALC